MEMNRYKFTGFIDNCREVCNQAKTGKEMHMST